VFPLAVIGLESVSRREGGEPGVVVVLGAAGSEPRRAPSRRLPASRTTASRAPPHATCGRYLPWSFRPKVEVPCAIATASWVSLWRESRSCLDGSTRARFNRGGQSGKVFSPPPRCRRRSAARRRQAWRSLGLGKVLRSRSLHGFDERQASNSLVSKLGNGLGESSLLTHHLKRCPSYFRVNPPSL
jgi:hypothetical protein